MSSKYSSFKGHQLITESWRRYLVEDDQPNPEELAQAGQDALEELGEEGVEAAVADLPPEMQAKIDEAAEAMVAKLDTQLSEVATGDEFRQEAPKVGAWVGAIGGMTAALVMAGEILGPFMAAWGGELALLGGAGTVAGGVAGAMVAAVILKVREKLGDPDLTSTIVTKPVGKPDAWEAEEQAAATADRQAEWRASVEAENARRAREGLPSLEQEWEEDNRIRAAAGMPPIDRSRWGGDSNK